MNDKSKRTYTKETPIDNAKEAFKLLHENGGPICSLSVYEMAQRGMELPKGTRIKTTQGGIPTGETHEINVEDANKISRVYADPRPFWCYGWQHLHDSLILPAN